MASQENNELQKRLLAIFQVEAAEHLNAMASLLQTLQQVAPGAEQAPLLETLFREAHSLKGAARSVNLTELEALCMGLESTLAALKRQPPGPLPPAWFERSYRVVDELEGLLAARVGGQPARPGTRPAPEKLSATATPPMPALPSGDTVRISTARLAVLLAHAEELLAFKFSAAHRIGELRSLNTEMAAWRKEWSRRARDWRPLRRAREKYGKGWLPDARTLPALNKLLDAAEHEEWSIKSLSERLSRLERQAGQEQRTLAGIVDGLQGDIRQALMLPFAALLELFPKLVRDLARDSGKEVELHSSGTAIEIDRRILEQIKDPLIHLVRNAVDHGIETAAERRLANKPPLGRIRVELTPREGNRIELIIADDGAGVDLDKVRAAAARLGLLSAEAAAGLGPTDVLPLMFESGLSTSAILTELSGRGLGLAIVREKVEKLGGSISAELPATGGTLFRLLLPSSLATFHGLLVALGERQFVLPSRSVERVLRVAADTVKTVENREAVEIDGRALSLVHLADVLGLPAAAGRAPKNGGVAADAGENYLQLAVLSGAGRRIAFVVDRILGDQEVLVKGLGPQLARVPNIAGATLLGTGRLVPILNVADLLLAALRARPASAAPEPAARPAQRSLLVVEDSVTARSLLKSILETAGYRVDTAVDGIDALTILRTGQFDLVISDVEMPRLDGFELTARIRADKRLAELPVVLVTALESREDKEHGIEVGANAYIVKSSFDQSNLFEVIRRLI